MAQSRHRHKHTHHAHPHHPTAGKQQVHYKGAKIMMIFLGVLGIFVAYVSAGPDLLWLTIGAAAGVVAGYLVGKSMDKTAGK